MTSQTGAPNAVAVIARADTKARSYRTPAPGGEIGMKPLLSHRCLAALTVAMLLRVSSADAQSGGPYDLRWNTIDAGGVTFASGGTFMLGGTAGQPDAGVATGGPYVLAGGFWPGISAVAVQTPTPTRTGPLPATSTATPVATATATMVAGLTPAPTGTPTPTATLSGMATPTATGSPAPTSTPTATGSLPPTPTATSTPAAVCVGDCKHDGAVTVDELITGVNIGLEDLAVDACPTFDANGDGAVTVNELITGVNNALNGCPRG